MLIAMANDHAGTQLKREIKTWLEEQGHEVVDFGTHDEEGCDLSDFVYPAAKAVSLGECERGIFVDGVGYGSAMIANKFRGVFACVCQDPVCAELARQHNDANVLCLGGKLIGPVLAMAIVKTWMSTDALTAEKYVRRRDKVCAIDAERTTPVD
jgi:ribose 5-phosphate isomerase B